MKCWYDGLSQLRKGNRLKITKGYDEYPYGGYEAYSLRVTLFEDLSTGIQYGSIYDGKLLPKPIIGRVVGSQLQPSMGGTGTTFIEIEEGNIGEDYVFVKAGELRKGQDALKEIFTSRIDEFVKICDPYINEDTIKLVSNVADSITIDILTQKIKKIDIDAVKKEAGRLPNKIIIKEGMNLHDRFILTKGEGWIVGHSLKDFGTKISSLTKLATSVEWEDAFDENWIQSKTIYDKN
jgi:hypothetical protein